MDKKVYKCPFCERTYGNVQDLLNCVNACGKKISKEDEQKQKKVAAARDKVNSIYQELKKAIIEYNKIATDGEFYSHLGHRSKEMGKAPQNPWETEKNKGESKPNTKSNVKPNSKIKKENAEDDLTSAIQEAICGLLNGDKDNILTKAIEDIKLIHPTTDSKDYENPFGFIDKLWF